MDTKSLELELNKAMEKSYHAIKKDLGYNSSTFFRMLGDHGGLETANRLINSSKPSEGYTFLWEHKRLDLSVEAIVLNGKWKVLFSEASVKNAMRRLKEYEYEI